jgi:hypothetical protein
MPGFRFAHPTRRERSPFTQDRPTPIRVVSISCKNMYHTLVEHAFGPILRSLAKRAGQRSGRDLHPHSRLNEAAEQVVM